MCLYNAIDGGISGLTLADNEDQNSIAERQSLEFTQINKFVLLHWHSGQTVGRISEARLQIASRISRYRTRFDLLVLHVLETVDDEAMTPPQYHYARPANQTNEENVQSLETTKPSR